MVAPDLPSRRRQEEVKNLNQSASGLRMTDTLCYEAREKLCDLCGMSRAEGD